MPRGRSAPGGGSSGPPDDRAWDRRPCTRRRSCPGRARTEARSGRNRSARARSISARRVTCRRSSDVVLEREPQSADRDLIAVAQRGASRRRVVDPHAIPPGRVAHLVLRADAADVQVMFWTAAADTQIAALPPPDDDRAVGQTERPFLAVGLPAQVGSTLLDDRRAEPGKLLGSHHERPAGVGVAGPGDVEKRRRLGRHVVEEERNLADGDLVATLDRRHARERPSVEKGTVPRSEIADEPLLVLKTELGLMTGYGEVVDDDFEPHLATHPDDRVLDGVDVVHLQGSPFNDQRQLWHRHATDPDTSNRWARSPHPGKTLHRRGLLAGTGGSPESRGNQRACRPPAMTLFVADPNARTAPGTDSPICPFP